MNLKEFYNGLPREQPPKTLFLIEVSELCGVSQQTVKNWVSGANKPREDRHLEVLEQVTGILKSDLFK